MVNSSRRPISIMKESSHFAPPGIKAKLPPIPVISVPSPVLEMAERQIKKLSFSGMFIRTRIDPPAIITIM